jgi:hypothetical protein
MVAADLQRFQQAAPLIQHSGSFAVSGDKMAGKSKKPGNAFAPMKAKKRTPRPKKGANARTLAHMKKRLSKPIKWS